MMNVILMHLTIVAAAGLATHRDWRPLGEFADPAACHQAAQALELKGYRCVNKYSSVRPSVPLVKPTANQ